ncbi:MAG: chromosome partitioning protein ParB [Planctomycetota bacterium]|nr:chromosome partitioning protein ParB [Planctomycetota bacterium]
MAGIYAEQGGGIRREWDVERIWKLAEDLPVEEISIEEMTGLDQVTWFGPNDRPTTRAIAMHAKRIMNCDLSYPVILTEDGRVFDGMHRVARQLIEGCEFIQVKRFPVNPEPDRTISVSS